jgi:Uma2 family endonuclease
MIAALWTMSAITLADLLEQLGDISPARIRATPAPGTATEQDLLDIHQRERRLYELVDGVLVEKALGFLESSLTCDLIMLLGVFLDDHKLGFLAGPDGAVRLSQRLVRIPDISFIAWKQLPSRERPRAAIADLAPALAVEVLSKENTEKEMARKVREYFLSGVQLVWLVDEKQRTVQVYTAPDQSVVLMEEETLDGGDVLPGLSLPLRQIFAGAPPVPSSTPRKKGTRHPAKRKPRKP